MPCNCDHMEPNAEEIRLSRIACLLDELDGKGLDRQHWRGFHPSIYDQTYDKYSNKGIGWEYDNTMLLLDLLSEVDITDYSLELQLWCRNWNEAISTNQQRMERLLEQKKKEEQKHHEILQEHVEAVRFAGLQKQQAMDKAKKYLTQEEIDLIRQ